MENEPPKRRDRLMGKLFGGSREKERKMTTQESAASIADFLGGAGDRLEISHPPPPPPPQVHRGPPMLALDTSKVSRLGGPSLEIDDMAQLQELVRARSRSSPPREKKNKGLMVHFADTYPEVIGEGGDECTDVVAEIGRRRRTRPAPPPSRPLPPKPPGAPDDPGPPPPKPQRRYDFDNDEDDFIPAPIRRTQTGYSSISDVDQSEIQPPAVSVRAPPESPPQPRAPPAPPVVQERTPRLLETSARKDENRRSFIEIQQERQREEEGRAFRSMMGDLDQGDSSPEPVRTREPARRKELPPAASVLPDILADSSSRPSSRDSRNSRNSRDFAAAAAAAAPPPPRSPLRPSPVNDLAPPVLGSGSPRKRSPLPSLRDPSPQAPPKPLSLRSPLPQSMAQDPRLSPLRTDSAQSEHTARSVEPEETLLNNDRVVDDSPASTFASSILSTSDMPYRPSKVQEKPRDPVTPSTPERGVQSVPQSATSTIEPSEEAVQLYIHRTKHLYELFRLYAEKDRALDSCRPTELCRAALWWFIKGRMALEKAIKNKRPANGSESDSLMVTYQAYTDLTKAYWLTEIALPEIAEGKFSPIDGEMGEIRQVVTSHLRKLSGSMQRNDLLPPEEPFMPQMMDKSIWVDYPTLTQDIINLLNGVSGSSLSVQQSARRVDLLEALPLGDTPNFFNYGRVPADVFLMEQGGNSDQTYLPCMLSIIRTQKDPSVMFTIASQDGCVTLKIQSNKELGPTWHDAKWRPDQNSIELKLPRGFLLAMQFSPQDFKFLWSIYDFSAKMLSYLYPRRDEETAFRTKLIGFHYFNADPNSRLFPKEAVGSCECALFERIEKDNNAPTGPRKFHRGFRMAVITGPSTRTLSGVTHNFTPSAPIQYDYLRGHQREPLLRLVTHEGSARGAMILSFSDEAEREKLLSIIMGTWLHKDEEVVTMVPLEGINISETLADTKGGLKAVQRLPWQRARIINDRYGSEKSQTVLAEKLRIEIDSRDKSGNVGTLIDRINVAPGEFRVRLGTKDFLTLQVLRQPQLDFTVAVLEAMAPKECLAEFPTLQRTIQTKQTIRTYRFQSFKDLHAFQAGITGYTVLFDGIASSLNISRRMMVVPIHKKWEAGTTRIQVVKQEREGGEVVQLLAFFDDWHHGKAMSFVLRGTDLYEITSRNGKAGLRFADAKFPLPRLPKDQKDPSDEKDGGEGREASGKDDDCSFVCLDLPDYAGEADDIVVYFEDGGERDKLAASLPAPVKGSRLSKIQKA